MSNTKDKSTAIAEIIKEASSKIAKLYSKPEEYKAWIPEEGEAIYQLYGDGKIKHDKYYKDNEMCFKEGTIQPQTSEGYKKLENYKIVIECKYKLHQILDKLNAKANGGKFLEAKDANQWLLWDHGNEDIRFEENYENEFYTLYKADGLSEYIGSEITTEEIKIALTGRVD